MDGVLSVYALWIFLLHGGALFLKKTFILGLNIFGINIDSPG
jgi:hypothetical protein